ncbi:9540_t:CDS:2, partial [Cetraspora pellucida]
WHKTGKNYGYSSSEGTFVTRSLTEDSITTECSEELRLSHKLSSCGSHLVVKSYTGYTRKDYLTPYIGHRQGWSKTTVIPTGAPVVTCVMEDDALTDHSEELRLSHKLVQELCFMIGCQECVSCARSLTAWSFLSNKAIIVAFANSMALQLIRDIGSKYDEMPSFQKKINSYQVLLTSFSGFEWETHKKANVRISQGGPQSTSQMIIVIGRSITLRPHTDRRYV